jgi:cytochrome P450
VPIPGNLRYRAGVARLDRFVTRVLGERRAQPGDRGDLLSMLLAARDDEGRPMSDKQIRDEVITLFLAGHETTATALSWTLVLLARHPEVGERLWREVSQILGDRLPCAEDLPRLTYAEAVVKEALRLYPPAYVIGREALADCTLGGYTIPARATIFFRPGSSIAIRDGSRSPNVSAPSAGSMAARRGCRNTSSFPSAAGRESASASVSR